MNMISYFCVHYIYILYIVSLVLSFLSLVYWWWWWWWWSWCMVSPHIPITLRWICRGLSRLEHGFSCGYTHVGGRGCVHCVCNFGPMLQVSRSTQKLLALPQVSEQTVQVEIHILSICSLLSLRFIFIFLVERIDLKKKYNNDNLKKNMLLILY